MSDVKTPKYYSENGIPLDWNSKKFPELKETIYNYMGFMAERENDFDVDRHLPVVVSYLKYVIYDPCWEFRATKKQLDYLRNAVTEIKTPNDSWIFISKCLEIGIDPL